ncbi:MAG: Eco57I restriction-modification methylase domain-containing protein [Chitinophagaceae bacterium]
MHSPEVFKQGGFDAVIGNPPYVRQEMLGDIKQYLQKKYKVFHGMADLYSYFVEKGIGLLNDKGFFGIIVANKWMRANYGEPLRKWFKEQSIYQIVDFGDLPVFQNATTYPCIVIAGKNVPRTGLEPMYRFVVDVKTLEFETLAQYINDNKENFQQDKLEDSGWNLGSEAEQKLLMKLNTFGTPLGDYVNGNIYYGIKTGLNEAFVIDEATKSRLIAEDKKSAEIIKPFLGGKNIKRYEVCRSNKFLIFTKRGIQIDNYPAVKTYLLQFKQQLVPKPKDYKGADWKGRKPGAYLWYELQDAIDYFEEFEKTKIVIPDIALQMQGTFDKSNFYLGNTGYIIPSDDKYLLGIFEFQCYTIFIFKIKFFNSRRLLAFY